MGSINGIPKYVHYCWFGRKPLPREVERYISTWKKYFTDYEFILWNEDNFPIEEYSYAKEAYEAKKMAFVSDVARIYALKNMGGVYLDTDVEVIRSMESILNTTKMVIGTEDEYRTIGTGFIASPANHVVLKDMMEFYCKNSFLEQDVNMSNTILLAKLIYMRYGLIPRNDIQSNSEIIIYPQDYFTARDGKKAITIVTNNTFCIHHFAASWLPVTRKIKNFIKSFLYRSGIWKV